MTSDINETEIDKRTLNYQDKAQKEFFDIHISQVEVKNILELRSFGYASHFCNKYLTKVQIPDGYPGPSNSTIYMYNKKEVYEIKKNNDFVLANCITQTQAIEYLDLPNFYPGKDPIYKFKKIVKDYNLKSYGLLGHNTIRYFIKDQIEAIKAKLSDRDDNKVKDFFDNHISQVEVKNILKLSNDAAARYFCIRNLTKIQIPDGYLSASNTTNYMFNKKEVYKIKEHNDFVLANCITLTQAIEYLDLPKLYPGKDPLYQFKKIAKDFNLEVYRLLGNNTIVYFIKDQVEAIKVKRSEEHDNKIKEFFDNHISQAEVKDILKLSNKDDAKHFCNKHLTKVKIPDGYPAPSSTTIYMYIKKEVYEIKKNNDFVLANCITSTQAIEYLDLPNLYPGKDPLYQLKRIVDDFNLESYRLLGHSKIGYFRKEQIEDIKAKRLAEYDNKICVEQENDNKIKEYFYDHITRQEAEEILKLGDKNVANSVFKNNLTKVKIPNGYPKPSGGSIYNKKEVYKIKENNDFILANCITQVQTIMYLDLPGNHKGGYTEQFRKVIKEFKLKPFKLLGHSNINYFAKEQIEVIKSKQTKFWEEYIAAFEIKETHPFALRNRLAFFDGLEAIEIPPYARIKASTFGAQKAYKREEFLTRIDSVINKREIYDTIGISYFDTFIKRLELIADELIKFNLSTYTKEKWFEFVESKLKPTQSFKTSEGKISQYISITANIINKALEEFDVPEVYSLSSKQLALVYSWAGSDAKTKLYYFLNKVDEDVKLQVMKTQSRNKAYGLNEVNKIRVKEIKDFNEKKAQESKKNVEIYDFEMYSKVFEFLSNIKLHTRNSINKILEDKDIRYPSIWLYLMLHLNNAWRHGDVTDFPRLHVYDLLSEFEITDFEWFCDNELTLEQSRRLIQRVINQEFRISKTQIKGHFFSSDVLAPAIATAILIIETFLVSTGVFDSETKYVPLFDFKTKYNEPTRHHLSNFFKGMDDYGDFIFKSKKMNKSVMTFIYHLSNMAGDDNALKLVQQLRNHIDPNSPLSYVDFDLEKIDGLTKHLFMRGEFGYIPSLLVQRIQGKELSFQEMTEQVYLVNRVFNGVFKVQSTVGFLNTVNHERAMIMKMIEESSLEECEAFLTDIFTGNLPSREEDIQCLMSRKGCQRTDLKTCLGCPYHIPSIYALTTLCKAILNDIKEYKATKNLARQIKIALSFNRKIIVLKEAIHQFGKDYVYSCIGLNEQELEDEMELIPDTSEFYI